MNNDPAVKKPLQWELNRSAFYRVLTKRFNLNEIQTLCADLDIEYEDLEGTTRSTKAIALFDFLERRERLYDLFKACQEVRPNTNWWEFLRPISFRTTEFQNLQKQLHEKQAEVGNLRIDNQRHETELANKQVKLERLQTELEQAQQEIKKLHTKNSTQKTEIDKLNYKIEQHLGQIKDLKEQLGQRDTEIDRLDQAITELNSQVTDLLKEVETLKVQLREEKEHVKQLNAQLSEAEKQVKQLDDQFSKGEVQVKRLRTLSIVSLIVMVLGIGGAWLVWGNGRGTNIIETTPASTQIVEVTRVVTVAATPIISDLEHIIPVSRPITTTGSVFYNFEDKEIPAWDYSETIGEKIITDTFSLVGSHSLAFKPNLTAREFVTDSVGSAHFHLDLPDPTHDQLGLFRIYIPESPKNLIAQIVIVSDEDEGEYHPYTNIPSGQWVTIARSTNDVPSGFTPEKIGLQFILEWPNDANTAYCMNNGPPPMDHEDEKCLEDVFVYVDAVELIPQNTNYFKSVSSSPELTYFGFENASVPDWEFDEEIIGSPWITSAEVYDGNYALAYDVNIRSRDNYGDDLAAASITLPDITVKNRAVIFHVYVPHGVPTNLAGQFSLSDRGVYGAYTSLTPGEWTTIAWMTSDSPEWEGDPNLNFHIILGGVDDEIEGHRAAYDGTVYIDDVEIFPMYRNYNHARPLASVLEVTKIYRFEYTSNLEEIEPVNENITDTVLATFNNRNVIQLNLQLPAHDFSESIQQSASGLILASPSNDEGPIDAVSSVIYVPEVSQGEFRATFVAHEQQDDGSIVRHYSPTYSLTPGRWTSLFWGTEFVEFVDGERVSWNPTTFDKFELWIANSEGYTGDEVYIDTVAFYRMLEPRR